MIFTIFRENTNEVVCVCVCVCMCVHVCVCVCVCVCITLSLLVYLILSSISFVGRFRLKSRDLLDVGPIFSDCQELFTCPNIGFHLPIEITQNFPNSLAQNPIEKNVVLNLSSFPSSLFARFSLLLSIPY